MSRADYIAATRRTKNEGLRLCSQTGVQNAVGDARYLRHLGHIVNANDVRTAENACGHSGGSALQSLGGRDSASITCQGGSEKCFARSAYQQRVAELGEVREACEEFVILRKAFAEADARIEDNLRTRNSGVAGPSDGCTQSGDDLRPNVARERTLVHGVWLTTNVHQNERQFVLPRHFSDTRIAPQSGNVVDDFRACLGRSFGYLCFARINRDGNAQLAAQLFQNRQNTPQFFFEGNRLRTGPRGFAADIDQAGAGLFHGERVCESAARTGEKAAVGKTVRS